MVQLERDVHELAAQRRQRVQPGQRQTAEEVEIVVRNLGHVEHADLEGVHVDFGRLAVQHHGVHTVEPLHCTLPVNPERLPDLVPIPPHFGTSR